jgi:hypothetical protein
VWNGTKRHLDRQPQEDAKKNGGGQRLVAGEQTAAMRGRRQLGKIKSAGGGVQGQESRQHRHAPGHGVKKELEGGAGPLGAAPHFDQEKSRDQAQFPEKKPMDEILRRERAEQPDSRNSTSEK